MRTTKPIATISFNSYRFLKGTLDRMVKEGFIRFYAFICHQPEEDEKKEHFHVFCLPAVQLDIVWFEKQFLEIVPDNPKPLKCLPFNIGSKWVDWYWYGIHDPSYLLSKNQSRKYHYSRACMETSDEDYLDELVRTNPNPKAQLLQVYDMILNGASDFAICTALNVPLRNLNYTLGGISAIRREIAYRASKKPHEEISNDADELTEETDDFNS